MSRQPVQPSNLSPASLQPALWLPGIATQPTDTPAASALRKSHFSGRRPISAYDASLLKPEGSVPGPDAITGGIRVWDSSYSSIDWLHDAIKGSVQSLRLQKHRSLCAGLHNGIDSTIVGLSSAAVAFMIVWSERWLFGFKNGHRTTG